MSQSTAALVIKYVSYLLIVFAAVWGLAAFPPVDGPARMLVDLIDWPLGDGSPAWGRSVMWLSSIGAGMLMGWSIMFLFIVVPAVERGDKQIIRASIIALVAWFVIDSAGSVASGVTSNAIFNVVMLVLLAGPLLLVKIEHSIN